MPDAPTHHDARPRLPPTVRLLGWISFFADISSEMAYPLLPLLVVGVLGASASSLGAIEGVAAVVVAGLTAWAGWRSDGGSRGRRARRRLPWIRWGYGLPVLGKTLLAVATGWTVVLAGRSIDRVGKGFRSSPRDALIADATEPTERGRAFGFHRGMDTAGALCGVVISGIALWWLGPSEGTDLEHALRVVLGIAAAMSLASFVLTFRLREPPPEPAPAGPIEDVVVEPAPGVMQAIASLPRRYFLSILPMVVFALGNSTDAFLLLRAS
ncbi:MAG: MFS transporter, partial [Phycisphaerales bacterium]|nr:MFS transporter [Phycisphaerales bacterium]